MDGVLFSSDAVARLLRGERVPRGGAADRDLRGLGLHANMEGAEFLGAFRTEPTYRLHSIDDIHPGMYAVESGGVAVAGELYRVPADVLARIEAGEPPNLYFGPVRLADGREVNGVLYPRELAEGRHRGNEKAPANNGQCDASGDA